MTDSTEKKPSHAMRKLVGAVVVAGATYAAEKIIAARRRKRDAKNNTKK